MTDLRRHRSSTWGGRSLAYTHGEEEESVEEKNLLKIAGFYVGGAVYGIDLMRIKEVIQAAPFPIRDVPHAPAVVQGVIQLRGVVIPVIDLRLRFGAPLDPDTERLNKLIIVSVRGRIVGLKVDRILGELRVIASDVRPAPSMLRPHDGPGADIDFFSGVCHVGTDMVFVLNLEALIDPGRVPPVSQSAQRGESGGAGDVQ